MVTMVASLPLTTGWITVYVLGGIALLAALGCCCCNCCNVCDCDCDCDCPGPVCLEDDCCGDCDGCGDCVCDGCGCEGCACAEAASPELAPAVATLPLLVPMSRRLPAHWLGHHPDTPQYDQDVFLVAGRRLCIGCFTTYPLFLVASAYLALAAPAGVVWWAWLAGGFGLALLQSISSAGLARLRWQKVVVKSGLGLGLALAVHGVLAAPWSLVGKQAALGSLLLLALASVIPRRRRMARS